MNRTATKELDEIYVDEISLKLDYGTRYEPQEGSTRFFRIKKQLFCRFVFLFQKLFIFRRTADGIKLVKYSLVLTGEAMLVTNCHFLR